MRKHSHPTVYKTIRVWFTGGGVLLETKVLGIRIFDGRISWWKEHGDIESCYMAEVLRFTVNSEWRLM